MTRAAKYDVAISATDFDALAAVELKRRLEPRLSKIYVRAGTSSKAKATALTNKNAFLKDARVVVVLHQRLWGALGTEEDAKAIRQRITSAGKTTVLVVPIDNSPVPSWLKGSSKHPSSPLNSDAVIEQIVAAVAKAGGKPAPETDALAARRRAEEEKRATARAAFLASQRAMSMITRELDALSLAVTKSCSEPGLLPDGVVPAVKRTPDRYTLQVGPVGLSFSWIRGRSNSIADGQLLVIEWAGQLGDNGAEAAASAPAAVPTVAPVAAKPTYERVLEAHATAPDDWRWRRADLDLCCYTTSDLAGQCVASVLRRLEAASN